MILGAILAGGAARRFGSDKALAEWNGKALIDHVVAALQPRVDAIVICGRDHAGPPAIADRPRGGMGPLGGLAAALHHASVNGFSSVLSVPCDTPVIASDVFAALEQAGANTYLRGLPVMGLWRSAHSALLDALLRDGSDHSMRAWAACVGAMAVDVPAPVNVNRIGDLERLRS